MTGPCKLDGERRAPGTCAEDGDRIPRDVVAGIVHGACARTRRPRSCAGASVRRTLRGGRGLLLREPAREQLVEIDGWQNEVRKAALRHEVRYRDPRVGEQHVRTNGADGAALVVGGETAHGEQASLFDLDEEGSGIALLGADRNRQHDFTEFRPDDARRGVDVERDLRVPVAVDTWTLGSLV